MSEILIKHYAWSRYVEERSKIGGDPEYLYSVETILLTDTGLPLRAIRNKADLAIDVRQAILETI
jgi:hypothetical protein